MNDFERKTLTHRIRQLQELPLPVKNLVAFRTLFKSGKINDREAAMAFDHGFVLFAQILRRIFLDDMLEDPNYVPNPAQALDLLPADLICGIMQDLPVVDSLQDSEHEEWEHASSCRILMEHLLRINDLNMPHLVAAARFHDIGHNVFRVLVPKRFGMIEEAARSESKGIARHRMEESIIHMTHSEAGAILLENWGFPESVWKPILYHHYEQVPPDYQFETAVLQFVDWIDSKARERNIDDPMKFILAYAGLEDLDPKPWIKVQLRMARYNEMRIRTFREAEFALMKENHSS